MSAVADTRRSADVERIASAGGVRIGGPSALGGGWHRIVSLTWTLGYLDWRLAFFGSALGYLWRLFKPAMYFGVYYVLWTQFIPLSDNVLFYPPLLLCGIMLYIFFSEATSMAVQSVLVRENLVRKIHFPRVVIPMSVITTALLNLVFNLFAVLIFMAASGVPLRATAWQVIPTFLFFLVFISALCMLLSSLFVRYRDVQPIWEVLAMAIFYATPILYPLEVVQLDWAQKLIMHNPFAITMQQIRHAVFDPSVPSAAEAIGGWGELSLVIVFVGALFLFGLWTFNRIAPDVAEEL
jgi:ABC-2 type transport system permease protein